MATLSDRQKVLVHLVREDAKFENPKDLLTYLAIQLGDRRSPLRDQNEYVNTLVQSGYESTTAQKFFDDYKTPPKTVKDAAKKEPKDEPVVEPDPPQVVMDDREEDDETVSE